MSKRPAVILRLDPVYEKKFRAICERNHRKFVEQVKVWVDGELGGSPLRDPSGGQIIHAESIRIVPVKKPTHTRRR